MSCTGYREKLSEALLRGESALNEAVAAHLRACPDCGGFYETQKRLLSAIDSGVRTMLKEEVPASLLPGVRMRIEKVEVVRQWPRRLLPAAGGAALILFIFITSVRWRSRTTSPQVVNSDVPFVREKKDPFRTGEPVVPSMHPQQKRLRAIKKLDKAEGVPQEAILSAEQAAVARFASERPDEMAEVVRAAELDSMDFSKPIEIVPLKIQSIEFAPLEVETENSVSSVGNGSVQFLEKR